MRSRAIPVLGLLAVSWCAGAARADEIRLKDGTKISGTIVGFENGAFRVETSYGFALIQKDKVADINVTAEKKQPEPKPKSTAPNAPPTAGAPAVVPAVARESSTPAGASPEANAPAPLHPPAKTDASAKTVTTASPAPPPAPPPAPEPPVFRDEIRGNLYVNLSSGFQMYKPPSWDLIPAARKALPDAVAALGTYDQTTLLVIGIAHTKDSLDAQAASTGKALGSVYDNYRLISSRRTSIAGFPAIEQRSRGSADGRDWSVLLVTFLRGNDAFTLLGMTWADSDLIQVQENVIAKTVNSLTFATQ
jgi:hypothetical protein